jgi:hypothetical protein
LLGKVTGLENVRDSAMMGGNRKMDFNDTLMQKEKLHDRLDGEVRNSNNDLKQVSHFSIVSMTNSLEQREGGQFTRHSDDQADIVVVDQLPPDLLAAKFRINMVQIDEV